MSLTGSGISISLSWETSCPINAIGNKGAKSSGPIGLRVPGCKTGSKGFGRSAVVLLSDTTYCKTENSSDSSIQKMLHFPHAGGQVVKLMTFCTADSKVVEFIIQRFLKSI